LALAHGDTQTSLKRAPRAIPLAKATEQRARLARAQADLALAELKAILGLLSGLQKATETVGFGHGDTQTSIPRTRRAIPLAKATEQRARLASAQADLAELKAAEKRGELLDAAEVERTCRHHDALGRCRDVEDGAVDIEQDRDLDDVDAVPAVQSERRAVHAMRLHDHPENEAVTSIPPRASMI
jgi:hypothetical protein